MKAAELPAILRGRDFRRLYGTRLASQLTDGVFQVALAGYVFFSPERQTTAAKAAAAFAVTLLPYSALGPFAGVFIDRWRRRQILVWAPVLRAVLVLLVAGVAAAGRDGPALFAGVLVVLGVNRFFLAALSAALPHVVRRDHLVTANAFSVTSGTVIAFVGGGIGYLLRRVFGAGDGGTALILVSAAGMFLVAGIIATRLPRQLLGPHPPEDAVLDTRPNAPRITESLSSVVDGLVDGARHLARRPQAALALGAIAFHRFLYGVILIMTLLLCRNHFADGPNAGLETFAVMLGLTGAGYFTAALITPPVVRRISKQAWVSWLLAAAALSLLGLGLPFAERSWAAAGFVLGVVSQGVKLCVDTTLQESIDDAYRGRVFAVYDMLFNAMFAAAAAAAATWLPSDGRAEMTLLAVTAAYAAGAVAYRTATARARRPAVLL
ncbi:MFS transporter [Actinomadura pelletieri DSM 43383]|uniref:MFS transporter n=1 Tax=Actinomadura pelletieri DSM 43383 TaxID=1120940 RepID=A0A495QYW9_9ACTN|nr:MFS transporter [Actinomadura pelletieri]RKS79312.1 MFS transporter [Actinomadura pelletieri DSM 43383]